MFHNSLVNFHNKNNNMTERQRMKNKFIFTDRNKNCETKPFLHFDTSIHELSKDGDLKEECLLNKKCPFYKKYVKMKNKFITFLSSSQKLKLINQSLYIALSEKNKLFTQLKEENNSLKGLVYNITGLKYSEIINNKGVYNIYKTRIANSTTNIKSKKFNTILSNNEHKPKIINHSKLKINLKKILNINPKNKVLKISNSSRNNFTSNNIKKNSKILNNSNNSLNASNKNENKDIITNEVDYLDSINNTFRSKTLNKTKGTSNQNINDKDYNPNEYYEMIDNYTKNQKLKINAKEAYSSYLSLNSDLMDVVKNNIALTKLENFTRSDDNFLKECKTGTNDTLFKYCDLINSLIGDYKEIVKLGSRMKDFIKGSIQLIESIISNDSSNKFTEITCNILKCDRASLFIIDKISDKLTLFTGEGMKKAQIKIDKNSGIVGTCFTECRVIRIEDAYLEEKFNKEVDKKTNYRTKSILCYPIIDKEGECFGVIEAINKINSSFSDDDQELLKLLSQEASSIFKSVANNDNNKFLLTKLYIVVDYSINIQSIKDKYEFTKTTEYMLLDLFSCMNGIFYFIKDNHIIRYFKDNEYKKYDINLGIVGEVIKTKEITGYKNIKNSEKYNSIIDIQSYDGLLTFPVLTKKEKKVCAILQVPYISEISKYGKPKESEIKIIQKLCKCIRNWIYYHEE